MSTNKPLKTTTTSEQEQEHAQFWAKLAGDGAVIPAGQAVCLVRQRTGKEGIDASGFAKFGIKPVHYTKFEERPDGSIDFMIDDGTIVYRMPYEDR